MEKFELLAAGNFLQIVKNFVKSRELKIKEFNFTNFFLISVMPMNI